MGEFTFGVAFRGGMLHATASWDAARCSPQDYALFLHGGGAATSADGTRYLREALAREGVACAAFDFSGHGRSGGRLADATLRQRQEEVACVVEALRPSRARALIATSMAGHTACRVLDAVRPKALVLFCPAAYEARAEDARFGTAFREVIRATRTFADSPALDALGGYAGRVLVVYGTADEVIPEAVRDGYAQAAAHARSAELVRLEGASHRLHDWLAGRASARRDLVSRLLPLLA